MSSLALSTWIMYWSPVFRANPLKNTYLLGHLQLWDLNSCCFDTTSTAPVVGLPADVGKSYALRFVVKK